MCLSVLAGVVLHFSGPYFCYRTSLFVNNCALSGCVGTDWSRHPKVCGMIFRVWGSPQVVRFATALSRCQPLDVSPLPVQGAFSRDSSSFQWDCLFLYAFHLFALFCPVLVMVLEADCEGGSGGSPVATGMLVSPVAGSPLGQSPGAPPPCGSSCLAFSPSPLLRPLSSPQLSWPRVLGFLRRVHFSCSYWVCW